MELFYTTKLALNAFITMEMPYYIPNLKVNKNKYHIIILEIK